MIASPPSQSSASSVPTAHPHAHSDDSARIAGLARMAGAAVRDWSDRALHTFRRARARRRVRRSRPVRSVLMVCHGNICRSPFAAAVLAAAARAESLDLTVTSAGFVGPRRRPPEAALRASQRRHVDLSQHTSALIDRTRALAAHIVCVMEARQALMLRTRFGRHATVIVLGDLDPLPVRRRAIADPWGCGDDIFDASYDRIERCIRELVHVIATSAPRTNGCGE